MCLGILQGHDFGVRSAGVLGMALSDHRTAGISDYAADTRVGGSQLQALSCDV
jgi:hypothetical protein